MACECTWTTAGVFIMSSTAASLGLFPPTALAVNANGIGSCSLLLAAPIIVVASGDTAFSTGQRFSNALHPDGVFTADGVFAVGGGVGGSELLPGFSRGTGCL